MKKKQNPLPRSIVYVFIYKKAPANYIAEAFRLFFIQMSISLYLLHDLLYCQYLYHFLRTHFQQNQ